MSASPKDDQCAPMAPSTISGDICSPDVLPPPPHIAGETKEIVPPQPAKKAPSLPPGKANADAASPKVSEETPASRGSSSRGISPRAASLRGSSAGRGTPPRGSPNSRSPRPSPSSPRRTKPTAGQNQASRPKSMYTPSTSSPSAARSSSSKLVPIDGVKSDGEDDYVEGDAGRIKFQRLKREVHDLRLQVQKLRDDLQLEKRRSRSMESSKNLAVKTIKESLEHVREKTTETVTVQMMQEKEQEVAQMRSALCREREQQIKEVIRGKKEEIKTMKYKMRQNRDEAVRVALDLQKKDLTNSLKRDFDKDLARLEGEVLSLKQEKQQLKDEVDLLKEAEREKIRRLDALNHEHQKEMTRVLNVNRREARRDLSELANMRRKLNSTTQEAAAKADLAKKVMRENNELRSKLSRSASEHRRPRPPPSGLTRTTMAIRKKEKSEEEKDSRGEDKILLYK